MRRHEIWTRRWTVVGDDKPDTLYSHTGLAVSLRRAGEHTAARDPD